MQILTHRLTNLIEKHVGEELNVEIGIENNSLIDILGNRNLLFREKKCVNLDFISFINKNPNSGYKIDFSFTDANYYNNNLKKYIFLSVTIDENTLLKKMQQNKFSVEEILYFKSLFLKNRNFKKLDLWKEKWTPDIQVSRQPNKIKAKLFKYQLQSLNWMKNIESFNNKHTLKCKRKFSEIYFSNDEHIQNKLSSNTLDMYSNKINSNENFYFTAKGGILADEMGLGKTLTTISLISERPYIYNANKIEDNFHYETKNIGGNEYLVTKSTLILCPSHLTKQWSEEITKNCKSLKHICILTKTNHEKYNMKDLLNCDVVITSFQFLQNINYYVNYMKLVDDSNRRYTNSYLYGENLKTRLKSMLTHYNFNKNVIETEKILFESIFWNRVVVDEAHEIFQFGCYGYSGSENNYLQHLFKNFKCNYRWFISGTPFFDKDSLINVMNFLDFKTEMVYNGIEYKLNLQQSIDYGLSDENIVNSILKQIYVRNTKESVKDQLNIPSSIFQDIFLELSDFEENIYKSCVKFNNRDYLRKICCNIQICEWFNNGNLNNILNFDEVKDKLIKENNEKIEKTQRSIELLDSTISGYEARKKKLINVIDSCKFFLNCINSENFKINEESCPICKCDFEDPIITNCGHHFCYECINEVLSIPSNKKECPICRADLKNSNMFKLNSDSSNNKNELDELVYKYGTKIAKLIRLCNKILLDKKNKIIIFSEWDRLLSMIGTILQENQIENLFCKGNVHQRNNTISRFRDKKNKDRVIMLSTENAASGSNLTEATHIIFMEPHVGEYGAVKAIEDQAIGRAERIGQSNQVVIHRLITKNTVEEDIFSKYKSQLSTVEVPAIETDIVLNNDI